MKNRILASVTALAIAATSGSALADQDRHRNDRGRNAHDRDYARVVNVEPLVQRVRYTVPVEQCWTEDRARGGYRANATGAAIVGGALGAILGSNVGRGDGRRAATLGGAVFGAAIGSELAKNNDQRGYREPRYEQVQQCRTVHEEQYDERVTGYRVTYVYNGRRQVTQLPYDPGRYLRVAVDVHPLG